MYKSRLGPWHSQVCMSRSRSTTFVCNTHICISCHVTFRRRGYRLQTCWIGTYHMWHSVSFTRYSKWHLSQYLASENCTYRYHGSWCHLSCHKSRSGKYMSVTGCDANYLTHKSPCVIYVHYSVRPGPLCVLHRYLDVVTCNFQSVHMKSNSASTSR